MVCSSDARLFPWRYKMSLRFFSPKATLRRVKQGVAMLVILQLFMGAPILALAEEHDRDRDGDGSTRSPIKHVIVIIGENRTFDNIYATYVPKHGTVWNLLSRGIVHADGSPGPNAALATQFQLSTINPATFFVDTRKLINPGKTAYSPFLPTPEAGS